jgi:hypothetical protein
MVRDAVGEVGLHDALVMGDAAISLRSSKQHTDAGEGDGS